MVKALDLQFKGPSSRPSLLHSSPVFKSGATLVNSQLRFNICHVLVVFMSLSLRNFSKGDDNRSFPRQ